MKNHSAREGEPSPSPNTPPLPPIPPTPIPQIPLETLWNVAKIVIFVMVWYITTDANRALSAAVDYSKLAEPGRTLLGISFSGALIGLLQGAIMSVQALAVIWASPTLFVYLGPVLSAALKTPIKLVAEFRKALQPRTSDGSDEDTKTADESKKT